MVLEIVTSDTPPLRRGVAHQQCDALWDVAALLEAVATPKSPGEALAVDDAELVSRNVHVVDQSGRQLIAEFGSYL